MNEIKMTVKEAIEQLTDLKRDREGFAENDEPNSVFAYDIKAIDVAVKALEEKQAHERRTGCDYCCGEANDRQVLIQPTGGEEDGDIYINIYNQISTVDDIRGETLNFCPMCGRRLVNEEEVLKDE